MPKIRFPYRVRQIRPPEAQAGRLPLSTSEKDEILTSLRLLSDGPAKRLKVAERSYLARVVDYVSDHHIVRLIGVLSTLMLTLGIATFILEGQKREDDRTFNSWQALSSNAPGNAGRVFSLEFLSSKDCYIRFPRFSGDSDIFGLIKYNFTTKCLEDYWKQLYYNIYSNDKDNEERLRIDQISSVSYSSFIYNAFNEMKWRKNHALSGIKFYPIALDAPTDISHLRLAEPYIYNADFRNTNSINLRFSRGRIKASFNGSNIKDLKLDTFSVADISLQCSKLEHFTVDRSVIKIDAENMVSWSASMTGSTVIFNKYRDTSIRKNIETFEDRIAYSFSMKNSFIDNSTISNEDAQMDLSGSIIRNSNFINRIIRNSDFSNVIFEDNDNLSFVPKAQLGQALSLTDAEKPSIEYGREQTSDGSNNPLYYRPSGSDFRNPYYFINVNLSGADLSKIMLVDNSLENSFYCADKNPPITSNSSIRPPKKLDCANDLKYCINFNTNYDVANNQCIKIDASSVSPEYYSSRMCFPIAPLARDEF